MSEQDIKQLLYKDMQRFKILNEKVNAIEKQVVFIHEHLTATTQQVVILGEELMKLAGTLSGTEESKNDNTN